MRLTLLTEELVEALRHAVLGLYVVDQRVLGVLDVREDHVVVVVPG